MGLLGGSSSRLRGDTAGDEADRRAWGRDLPGARSPSAVA